MSFEDQVLQWYLDKMRLAGGRCLVCNLAGILDYSLVCKSHQKEWNRHAGHGTPYYQWAFAKRLQYLLMDAI